MLVTVGGDLLEKTHPINGFDRGAANVDGVSAGAELFRALDDSDLPSGFREPEGEGGSGDAGAADQGAARHESPNSVEQVDVTTAEMNRRFTGRTELATHVLLIPNGTHVR